MTRPFSLAYKQKMLDRLTGKDVVASPRPVAGPGILGTRSQYAVAPDGRFLMNVRVDEAAPAPPITVVVNWAAGLKK